MNDETLEAALQANAKAATPAPDPAFLQELERRLMTLDTAADDDGGGRVVPFARRARRLSGATLVVTLAIAGVAAAAAGIVVTRPFASDEASAPDSVVPTSVPVETTFAPVESTVPVATTAPLTATTVPAVVPTVAPTTTEVHTPAVMTLTCTLVGTNANCSWTAGPAGTDHYLVLRGQLVPSGPGNVLFPAPGATDMVVPLPVTGAKYSIVIQAMDASDHSVGHSTQFIIDCC